MVVRIAFRSREATGGGKETRTPDPHAASVMLYQLSYAPSACDRSRGRLSFGGPSAAPFPYPPNRIERNSLLPSTVTT
jgi:hypothetical protein